MWTAFGEESDFEVNINHFLGVLLAGGKKHVFFLYFQEKSTTT